MTDTATTQYRLLVDFHWEPHQIESGDRTDGTYVSPPTEDYTDIEWRLANMGGKPKNYFNFRVQSRLVITTTTEWADHKEVPQ